MAKVAALQLFSSDRFKKMFRIPVFLGIFSSKSALAMRFHRSIRTKIMIMTSAIVVGSLAVLTYAISVQSAKLLREESERQLENSSQQSVDALLTFLDMRDMNLDVWTVNPVVQSLVENSALASVFTIGLQDFFRSVQKREPWLKDVVIFSEGKVVFHLNQAMELDKLEGSDEFAKRLMAEHKGPDPFVLNMAEMNSSQKEKLLALMKPVLKDGAPLGNAQVMALFDLDVIYSKLFKAVSIGKSGFVSLVVTHSEGEMQIVKKDLDLSKYAGYSEAVAARRRAEKAPLEVKDVIVRSGEVPAAPISVITVASISDIRAPVLLLTRISLALGVLAAAFAVVIAFFFSGKMTRPIRSLTGKVRQLADGKLDAQAEVVSIDEIGVLAESFNAMGRSLRERIEDIQFLQVSTDGFVNMRELGVLSDFVEKELASFLGADFELQVLCCAASSKEHLLEQVRRDCAEDSAFLRILSRHSKDTLHGFLAVWNSAGNPISKRHRSLLETLAQNVEMAIDNIMALVESAERAAMEYELKTAQTVQDALFTTDVPRVPGWDIAAHFAPAAQLGGDWFRVYFDRGTNRIRCYIGDVTGHGVSSALVTAAAMAVVHLIEHELQTRLRELPLEGVLNSLNRTILEIGRKKLLMTFCICEMDVATGAVSVANAAHNHPMLLMHGCDLKSRSEMTVAEEWHDVSARTRFLAGRGSRLGFSNEPVFSMRNDCLDVGSVLVLYTDGLTEALNPRNEQFGTRRLRETVYKASGGSASDVVKAILDELSRFREGAVLCDDVSFVVINRIAEEFHTAASDESGRN